ncbi:Chemotaxis response regulator protein-glutamate methylesterase of group 3 operon [Maioricimonas rarisocia]|uniref:Protein-glutamate methylesterase/protein-glutamine glutaminase n=1 Tax=Maioricimonas rarisocia TaxID=2528026 RepID=A0A517ZAK2_9PLAN|nr:chemotaxis-specific protein-glutamate methyltransferase CheB [Maioricimonas rarisocia]QDU39523.1 Chemotaxis response regulator protein-glutamate methylesterase of group 3 operon [Maioricimonas rarisocia]
MLRVLVVDDSPVSRDVLCEILASDPGIELVGVAKDGIEAVERTRELRPDVITMDVEMPRLDGYAATEEIMIAEPTPIVVVSGSMSRPDIEKSMNSLRAGALTVIGKPPSPQSPEFESAAAMLIETVKTMAHVKVIRRHRRKAAAPKRTSRASSGEVDRRRHFDVVAVAASTGGPPALLRILSGLTADFPLPILVVQHISAGFSNGFARWLDVSVSLRVKVADDREPLVAGTVYVAPEDTHLGVGSQQRIALSDHAPVEGFRPSATVLFESVAQSFGQTTLALILTGMGCDGVEGLRAVRHAGGQVIAQNEATCVVYGMPGAAVEAHLADRVLPLDDIASVLDVVGRRALRDRQVDSATPPCDAEGV